MIIDCIGIVKSVAPLNMVQQRVTGKTFAVVQLLLSDETGHIEVSLWNELVTLFSCSEHQSANFFTP